MTVSCTLIISSESCHVCMQSKGTNRVGVTVKGQKIFLVASLPDWETEEQPYNGEMKEIGDIIEDADEELEQ